MPAPQKISVFGESGRMGKEVMALIRDDPSLKLISALEKKDIDVVIDFSSPEGLVEIASWCGENKVPLVSGTTGFSLAQEKEFKKAATKTPIFWSPNMSVGLNTMLLSLKNFCQNFKEGKVTIEETHHINKKDSPSGTAKRLYKMIKENISNKVTVSEPISHRVGDVFGVHKVEFFFNGERVSFGHVAESRLVFAQGAIKVAKWLIKQKAGYYEMEDYLGSKK